MTKKQKTAAAWTVVIIAFFGGFALANVQNKVPPCIDVVMMYFNIGETDAGWLTSVFTIMGMITAIPAAALMRKMGPKKIGVISLACAAVGGVIGAFATDLWVLMATRVLEGVGVGLMSVIGPSLIAMWFPEAKRGLPMSIWAAYQMGAQAVMFFLGAVLTTSFGWQGVWWFGLVACVVAFVLYVLCVKSPRPEDSYADVESEDVSIVEGMKSPSAWVLSLATMLFCIGCFGFVNWIATCWAQTFSWDEGQANMWVGYFSIFGVIAAVVIGALLNHVKNRKLFGVAALVAYGVASLVGMFMDNPSFLIGFVIVYGFVDAGFPCVLWTMAAQTVKKPELAGVALGVVSIGFNVGILLGPPIIGAVVEAAGWHAGAIAICGACVLGAVALLFTKLYSADDVPVQEVPEAEPTAA